MGEDDEQTVPDPRDPGRPEFEEALPPRLGPYRIEGRLGSGGMGEVFRGFDERLTRAVAIKWVHPAALGPAEESDLARRRFRREARAAARINHPTIVQIYHVLELHDDGDAIVMELVDGRSLAEILRQERSLDAQQTVELLLQIAAGLAEAHAQGVIHRDLKPANIMLTPSGQVKILDFGLATGRGVGVESDRLTRPGEAVGSYDMMSPEQARGEEVDPRSDLFSLGILSYLMLTGTRPFWGNTPLTTVAQICREPHPELRSRVPDAPRSLVDLVDRLLEKSPANRPQDAGEVRDRLEHIAAHFGPLRIPTLPTGPVLRALTILDLVDREALWERLGDRRAGRLLQGLESLIDTHLSGSSQSRRLELPEGSLFLFENPIEAVNLAMEVHRKLREEDRDDGGSVEAFAVVHFGEVQLAAPAADDGVVEARAEELGPAVALVGSLAKLARGGQTLLTRSAFDLSRSSAGQSGAFSRLRWLAHGKFQVPASEEPVGLFEVGEPGIAPFAPPLGTSAGDPLSGPSQTILGWRPAAGQSLDSHPNWRLTERLGDGSFGEVWLAEHRKTGERRLFKFCFHRDRLRELQREITLFRILKDQLGERQDIARILDWNFDEAPYFVESEYTEGGNLVDWVRRQGGCEQVALARRLEIVAQVADALAAAHSVGVLHKDVKPSNILVQDLPDGGVRVRLADFGVGTLTDDAAVDPEDYTVLEPETGENLLVGASLYRAPEVVEGRPATIQADIYALGVLLYQMVIGDLSRALGSGWERSIDDDLLMRDIAGAVDISPTRRFGDASRMAQRLRRLDDRRARLEERRVTEAVASEARLQEEQGRRRWRLALTAVAILGCLALLGTWQRHQVGREVEAARERAERAEQEARLARESALFLAEIFRFEGELPDPESEGIKAVLSRGAEEAREALSDRPRLKATVLEHLARAGLGVSDYAWAEMLSEEAYWIWRGEHGEHALETLRASCLAASALRQRGDPTRALERIDEVLPSFPREGTDSDPRLRVEIAGCFQERGHILTDLGQIHAARDDLQKARSLRPGGESVPEP